MSVRSFALTLHFHSPRAYNYLRERFDKHLPNTATIRKWYANSNSNGEPGICQQTLSTLKTLSAEMKAKGEKLVVALSFDEMAIRKNVKWSDAKKKFLGQITYGNRLEDDDNLPTANNAIVFLVTGVNSNFSLPVAYYFINNNLNCYEKEALISEIANELTHCDIRLITMTFDGAPTNFTTCELLGASFNDDDFRPYFQNPIDKSTIYIILDPSHMEKLARNCLAEKETIFNGSNLPIEWKYFVELENFRENNNLSHLHKLTKQHIQWMRAKMNVRIAVETLSHSVASTMQLLKENGVKEFLDSGPTSDFAIFCDDVFDISNSKSIDAKNEFKSALNIGNKEKIFAYFAKAIDYFKALKLQKNGKTILKTKRKTFARGFIINMKNFMSIYEELVGGKILSFLPTFRFSQDFLESLFGRIRQLCGCNDNPTAEQFISAFRKIQVNNEIKSSAFSNCKDQLSILFISSRRPTLNVISETQHATENVDVVEEETTQMLQQIDENAHLTDGLEDHSVAYVAGVIEKKILSSRFDCGLCFNVLKENGKICDSMILHSKNTQLPCRSTYLICKVANQCFKIFKRSITFSYSQLINAILRRIDENHMFTDSNFDGHATHKHDFIKYIAEEFIRVQATYVAKKITLSEQQILLRKKLVKILHFKGQ